MAIKHFISDEWDKARALKGGGEQTSISLDETAGEDRYRREPIEVLDAEKVYERRWALTLLEAALASGESPDSSGHFSLPGHSIRALSRSSGTYADCQGVAAGGGGAAHGSAAGAAGGRRV